MKKLLMGLLLLSTVFCAESKILATVGNIQITTSDLQAKLDSLPAQYASFYSSEEGKKKLLEQLVQEKLFYLSGKAKNIEKDAEVVTALEKMREDVIMNYYLKKEMEKVTVSDKEIKDYYEKNKDKYMAEASIRASHILVKEQADAQAILKELQAGKSFEELAKEKSSCPSAKNGGDLGYFTRGQMVKPFEDTAFALKAGEVTPTPVQTQFGWHIIKVTDKKEAQQKDFSEIKGDIRSQLLYEKQKQKINDLSAAARQKYSVVISGENLNNF